MCQEIEVVLWKEKGLVGVKIIEAHVNQYLSHEILFFASHLSVLYCDTK